MQVKSHVIYSCITLIIKARLIFVFSLTLDQRLANTNLLLELFKAKSLFSRTSMKLEGLRRFLNPIPLT